MAGKALVRRNPRRYTTRRLRARRKNPGLTLPLAAIAGFAPLAGYVLADMRGGGLELVAKGLSWRLTGYNVDAQKFDPSGLMQGLAPILLGGLVHKLASAVGINRLLASAGVPWFRV